MLNIINVVLSYCIMSVNILLLLCIIVLTTTDCEFIFTEKASLQNITVETKEMSKLNMIFIRTCPHHTTPIEINICKSSCRRYLTHGKPLGSLSLPFPLLLLSHPFLLLFPLLFSLPLLLLSLPFLLPPDPSHRLHLRTLLTSFILAMVINMVIDVEIEMEMLSNLHTHISISIRPLSLQIKNHQISDGPRTGLSLSLSLSLHLSLPIPSSLLLAVFLSSLSVLSLFRLPSYPPSLFSSSVSLLFFLPSKSLARALP